MSNKEKLIKNLTDAKAELLKNWIECEALDELPQNIGEIFIKMIIDSFNAEVLKSFIIKYIKNNIKNADIKEGMLNGLVDGHFKIPVEDFWIDGYMFPNFKDD